MSFATYLDSIREKPHHVRKRYAFWSAFGVTAVIASFWLASFRSALPSAMVSSPGTAATKNPVVAAVDKAGTPGQSLVAGVGALANDVWTMIAGPKKVQYSEVEALPGNGR